LGLSQVAGLTGDITVQMLIEKNMVPADAPQYGVKVLYDKDITQAITLAVSTSATVKAAVEKAGGKVIPQS
jgi:ribosomal protein L15